MTQPQKSGGGAVKWILLGCGGLVFIGITVFAIGGYFIYKGFNTDPAKVEVSAKEIVTFEKPEGFKGVFSMSMMGLKMAMLMRNPTDESAGSIIIASFPAGKGSQEQFQKQIDDSMKQQGRSREVSERRPAETFKVRGKEVTAEVGLIGAKDSPSRSIQYTVIFEGEPGKMAMIVLSGPEKTTDHDWVQKFLDTVK